MSCSRPLVEWTWLLCIQIKISDSKKKLFYAYVHTAKAGADPEKNFRGEGSRVSIL